MAPNRTEHLEAGSFESSVCNYCFSTPSDLNTSRRAQAGRECGEGLGRGWGTAYPAPRRRRTEAQTCPDDRHVHPELPRHPEVRDLTAIVLVQQEVGALDVAMDEALAVEELQRPCRVRQYRDAELPPHLSHRAGDGNTDGETSSTFGAIGRGQHSIQTA